MTNTLGSITLPWPGTPLKGLTQKRLKKYLFILLAVIMLCCVFVTQVTQAVEILGIITAITAAYALIKHISSSIVELETQLSANRDTIQALWRDHRSVDGEITSLESQKATAESNVSSYQSQISSTGTLIVGANNDISYANKMIGNPRIAQSVREYWQGRRSKAQTRLSNLQTQLSNAKANLAMAQGSVDSISREIFLKQFERSQIAESISRAEQESRRISNRIYDMEVRLNQAQQRLLELIRQRDDATSSGSGN